MTEKSYDDMIKFPPNNKSVDRARKNAFKFANDCRNKEIDRFWTRGLYFWGFIVASFGAYMAVFNAALKNDDGLKDAVSLSAILEMSFTAKLVLFILSFICFVFCLSWLLVHKGSKFWQKNWERHIDCLEGAYMGKVYKSHLDTNNKCEFDGLIFNTKAYDYSVSKVSLLCSMLLCICSLSLLAFHFIILILELMPLDFYSIYKNLSFWVSFGTKIAISLVIFFGLSLWFFRNFLKNIKGNVNDEKDEYDIDHSYFISCGKLVKVID